MPARPSLHPHGLTASRLNGNFYRMIDVAEIQPRGAMPKEKFAPLTETNSPANAHLRTGVKA